MEELLSFLLVARKAIFLSDFLALADILPNFPAKGSIPNVWGTDALDLRSCTSTPFTLPEREKKEFSMPNCQLPSNKRASLELRQIGGQVENTKRSQSLTILRKAEPRPY
jgi:hypothetical protein